MRSNASEQSRSPADRRLVWTLTLALLFIGGPLLACGPNFPNMLLNQGDSAVLVAPVASFKAELERMDLVRPRFPTRLPANGHAEQTLETELQDLRAALRQSGLPEPQADTLVKAHEQERRKLRVLGQSIEDARLQPRVLEGLPPEFADYFRGSIAWHLGRTDEATAAWENLLRRPAGERHSKSTWAAFMLGRAESTTPDPDWNRAIARFQEVRQLAAEGYLDSPGLAASSIGWEAQAHLKSGNYPRALELYLEQAAGNDPSAVMSLQWTAERALNQDRATLARLASEIKVQSVITAYVISSTSGAEVAGVPFGPVARWLEAVETANVRDVASAERLALAAYQSGRMDLARRWIQRAAPGSVAARWLQAKLHLFDGDIDRAAKLLSQVVRDFQAGDDPAEDKPTHSLAASLSISTEGALESSIPASNQILGELGVLRLAQRDYTEALDALLRSGFWVDAAYVAERILSTEELRVYVDRHWPAPVTTESAKPEDRFWMGPETAGETRAALRHLLARRLAREGLPQAAPAYFPEAWRDRFQTLQSFLERARKMDQAKDARATAWFEAAKLTRKFGLELYGTEVGPDWNVYGGDYTYGVTLESRIELPPQSILAPRTGELERARRNHPDPEKRFHYRYTAASLAMEAANLLPDNHDETARILCIAGCWLKNRDPIAADVYYKALVRRCRKTALGAEADRLRWFPRIDEEGKLLPRVPPPGPRPNPPDQPDINLVQSD
ncbi:MAG: hypothetical protein K9N62_16255 [Verrucomicrobia bacterium]|nr:hypothetical protein [Verrucomicrobiota bacterium]